MRAVAASILLAFLALPTFAAAAPNAYVADEFSAEISQYDLS